MFLVKVQICTMVLLMKGAFSTLKHQPVHTDFQTQRKWEEVVILTYLEKQTSLPCFQKKAIGLN